MPRIRTIKPEFPQSESMGRVSRDARLLFVMLWTICDDSGKSRAASRMLASLLFPYDDDAPALMEGWLAELEREGCIARYEVGGSTYLQIRKWLSHQKIDKPSPSRLPEFGEASREVAKPREPSSSDLVPSTLDLGPRTIGPRIDSAAKAARAPSKPNDSFKLEAEKPKTEPKRKTRLPDGFPGTDDELWAIAEWRKLGRDDLCNTVAARLEVDKFRDHQLKENRGYTDWGAAWRTWVRNAVEFNRRHAVPRDQPRKILKISEAK